MDRDEHAQSLTVPDNNALVVVTSRIPSHDLREYHALSTRNQDRVRKMLEAVSIIEAEPVRMVGYQLASAYLAGMKGASVQSLRVNYGRYIKSGRDWREFIDGALEWKPSQRMPVAFLEEVQRRANDNKRSIATAIKLLHAEWVQGVEIPGYGTWRQWWKLQHPRLPLPAQCPGFPDGWTLRNLRRKLDSSRFRRIAQIQGLSAAQSHKPLVYTTRAGLWVGSHYQFDDLWHDFFVTVPGQGAAGRPLELFAHDLFSARKFRWGMRIRTEDDNGKAQGLTAKMTRMLVASVLACDGYSPRGTVMMAEHGTAAISEAMEAAMYDGSGGLITVCRSGMQGAAAHDGQYGGISKGNPRHKASLESSNNLTHNLTAHLPGQTGPNRDRRPESLGELLRYNEQLLAAAQQLPPALSVFIQYPLLTDTQAMQVLTALYRVMDEMPHMLEGWEAAGNVVAEALILGQWLSQDALMALPPHEQQAALSLLESGTIKTRPRRLTRGEVWQRGAGDLVKMQGGVICQILGDEFASERSIRRHLFEFQDAEIGPGLHRYESKCTAPDGSHLYLQDGGKYLCTVNPFAADELMIRDAKGRFLGTCPRLHSITRGDNEALQRAFARVAEENTHLLEPLRKQQAHEARARLALQQHNVALVRNHLEGESAAKSDALSALAGVVTPKQSPQQQPTATPQHNEATADW